MRSIHRPRLLFALVGAVLLVTTVAMAEPAAAAPTLFISDVSVVEGNSGTRLLNFALTLSEPAAQQVSARVSTDNGTANSLDYQPKASTVKIKPGKVQAKFSVRVFGDTAAEANETLSVQLSNVVGAPVGRSVATGTIINDDIAPVSTPVITASTPVSPNTDSSPQLTGTSDAGTTVSLYTDPACTTGAVATGTAAEFASPGLTVTVSSGTTQTFYPRATGAGGTSLCGSGFTYEALSGPSTIDVTADISGNTTWTADNIYVLKTEIDVLSGTLTIQPGTVIKGDPGSSLVITSNAKIDATGTSANPVVFTSSAAPGGRFPGDWGGLVLLGAAPVNYAGGVGTIDGFVGFPFGGADDAHDCGKLKYVRIEFAGFDLGFGNRLGALTAGGCGTGTELDNIQVHKAAEDGLDIRGGTANIKHIVISQANDDSIDWDAGWTGKAQFVVIQQSSNGDAAIEGDNNVNGFDNDPRSNPTFWNVTMIGSNEAPSGTDGQGALKLRRGTAGTVQNAIFANFTDYAIDLDSSAAAQATLGSLEVETSYFFDNGDVSGWPAAFDDDDDDGGFDEETFFQAAATNNIANVNPQLAAPLNLAAPSFLPAGGSPVLTGGGIPPGGFFDATATFIGAIGATDWTLGWTAFPTS